VLPESLGNDALCLVRREPGEKILALDCAVRGSCVLFDLLGRAQVQGRQAGGPQVLVNAAGFLVRALERRQVLERMVLQRLGEGRALRAFAEGKALRNLR
jgi:hypothetical protein